VQQVVDLDEAVFHVGDGRVLQRRSCRGSHEQPVVLDDVARGNRAAV
jgi:hypothetical protein